MTVGEGEAIVINPGTRQFETRTPGALFVGLSRAKSSGGANVFPDFAFHPDILVSEDWLCYVVNTSTTKARTVEITRIQRLAENTKHRLQLLHHPYAFGDIVSKLQNYIHIHEE